MADATSVMRELEAMGTAQNRKVYARHGAGENMYGVSFANLYKLRKAHKHDHELALALWKTGNTDARLLAAMIADPAKISQKELTEWVDNTNYFMIVDYIASSIIAQASWGEKLSRRWMRSRHEFRSRAGWTTFSVLCKEQRASREDARYALEFIQQKIHAWPNRAREAMNGAMIAIGLSSLGLAKEALAVAKAVGKVEIDHGTTNCKTPDAVERIQQGLTRSSAKRASSKPRASVARHMKTSANASAKKGKPSDADEAQHSKTQTSRSIKQGGAMKKKAKRTSKKAAKKTAKKAAAKKTAKKSTKKSAAKKTSRKKPAAKKAASKKAAKKSTKKSAAKKTAKKSSKKAAKKSTAKKSSKKASAKKSTKKPAAKKRTRKKAAAAPPASA